MRKESFIKWAILACLSSNYTCTMLMWKALLSTSQLEIVVFLVIKMFLFKEVCRFWVAFGNKNIIKLVFSFPHYVVEVKGGCVSTMVNV